ncbi:XRE family transcriptional regulator [Lentzea sp. NPDC051213]|uniref:nSTAND1 domain-containing NTPase n=1 Tax=Lentzea sp. NPDC051213 TaxID=3364126 RepID=UPI0037B5EC55
MRELRANAGSPPYRTMSAQAHYSAASLSDAAGGRKLPTLQVTLAYVSACGGSLDEWEKRWYEVARELVPDGGDGPAPYVGLAAFQREDADRFFGREKLVDELVELVGRRRFVAVFGASGSGKSSLLRAGLVPRLGDAVVCTPSRRTEVSEGAVLVVDQFEEIFTLWHENQAREFVDELIGAPHRVVIGVRADFFAHCTAFPKLVELLRDGQLTVGPMGTTELRQAVIGPAVQADCALEGALQATIMAEAAGQAGVLPLLSHALLETWRRRRGNTLTLDGYRAAGGLTGALAQSAETTYDSLSPRQREVCRNLFLRLTVVGQGTEDTKRVLSRAELDDDPDIGTVLDRLASARLVMLDRDHVEIAHEALIRSWPRLRDWLAQDRDGLRLHRQLTEAAGEWRSLGHDPGALYRGTRLSLARDWAARHGGLLSGPERRFLDASHAAETRRARALRRTVAVLSVLLVLAAGAVVVAVRAERASLRLRDVALSQVAAAKAVEVRRTDPALAAQLCLSAYQLARTAEAHDCLLGAFPVAYGALRGHSGHVNSVAFSPDGRTLASGSHDGTARLWDLADLHAAKPSGVLPHGRTVNGVAFGPTGTLATASWDGSARLWQGTEQRRVLSGHSGDVNAVAFGGDSLVATASTDKTVKLWGADPITLTGSTTSLVSVAFAPGSRLVAAAGWDGSVLLWDLADPARPTVLKGHRGAVVWVAFSPDGTLLATASQDNTVRLWDSRQGKEVGVITGHERIVRSVAFHPNGRMLVTGSEDNTARLWDISEQVPRLVTTFGGHSNAVTTVAFSPDGRTLATGGDDDIVLLWDVPERPLDTAESAAAWVCGHVPAISGGDWDRFFPGVPFNPPCS